MFGSLVKVKLCVIIKLLVTRKRLKRIIHTYTHTLWQSNQITFKTTCLLFPTSPLIPLYNNMPSSATCPQFINCLISGVSLYQPVVGGSWSLNCCSCLVLPGVCATFLLFYCLIYNIYIIYSLITRLILLMILGYTSSNDIIYKGYIISINYTIWLTSALIL